MTKGWWGGGSPLPLLRTAWSLSGLAPLARLKGREDQATQSQVLSACVSEFSSFLDFSHFPKSV